MQFLQLRDAEQLFALFLDSLLLLSDIALVHFVAKIKFFNETKFFVYVQDVLIH